MFVITVVLMMVLLVSSVSFSQVGFGRGIKGGLVTSTFTGDDASTAERRVGYIAGVFMNVGAGPLVIQPEVLYVMKGADFEEEEEGTKITIRNKLGYLEIPVLVKLSIGAAPAFKLELFGGPSMALLLSAKAETESGPTALEVDIKDNLKTVDVGFVVGVGLGLSKLYFDVRYVMGSSSIDDTGNDSDVKNSVLAATVGISM